MKQRFAFLALLILSSAALTPSLIVADSATSSTPAAAQALLQALAPTTESTPAATIANVPTTAGANSSPAGSSTTGTPHRRPPTDWPRDAEHAVARTACLAHVRLGAFEQKIGAANQAEDAVCHDIGITGNLEGAGLLSSAGR